MANKKIQETALVEIVYLLLPLRELDSAEKVISFMDELGYTIPVADVNNDLKLTIRTFTDLVTGIKSLISAADKDKGEEIIKLLPTVKDTFTEVQNLVNSFQTGFDASSRFLLEAPIDELPKRLIDYLLFTYLYKRQPKLFAVLYLTGILDDEDLAINTFQRTGKIKVVRWERIPQYFTKPKDVINELYSWETDFNSDKFLGRVELFLRSMAIPGGLYKQNSNVKNALQNTAPDLNELRIPVFSTGIYPDTFTQFGVNFSPAEQIDDARKKGLALMPYFVGTAAFNVDLNEEWEAIIKSSVSIDTGAGLIVRPPFQLEVFENIFSTPTSAGSLDLSFTAKQKVDGTGAVAEIYLFGEKDSTHLFLKDISASFFASSSSGGQDAGAEAEIKTIDLLITTEGGDSFLSKILPSSGINATFGLGVGFSMLNGIYFKGSAGIEILLPVHIQLGPIDISGINIVIKPKEESIPIEVSSTIKAELGPLQVVVENIGLTSTISFPSNGEGNLGPIDLSLGFKPPNGLGLSINAGAVTGGGYLFFDFEKEEYAGALELSIAGFISAKAIGLITTKMPDGSKGFSMLIIITAEFNPPFQLGYGFTLIGVGGLLGLNRTVLLDPLRDGVRTGAVNSIMFPQNVIANAPRIISDLKTIFPPYEGKFLIGPMAKIGWGTPTLISLSLGLIIEIPGNIAILGVLKIALPVENAPLVQIQVAFLGTIDFNKKMLTFDASLYESYILTMTLEGDMAVRLKWGDNPDFILSVGGFHPSYTPPPLALPTLRRLAINILNTSIAKIRVECYQAITSNTVQFGAKAEIFFDLSACSIKGHIAFDALFQFSPFYFIIDLSASFTLKAIGIDVMSVRVKMSLEGPTPWRAKGTGSVSLLFFDISANFDKTWGEKKNTDLPDIIILPRFIEELNKKEQWSTVLFSDKNLLVSLRNFKESSTPLLILHPAGSLVIQQKLLPLMVKIDKIGNQKTSDIQKITISNASSAGVALHISNVDENFARAQYQNLSDADKLSKPSFEKMPGGVEISMGTGSINNGKFVRKKVEYEVTIVDKEAAPVFFFAQIGILFTNFLKGNSASKSPLSKNRSEKLNPFSEKVKVKEEGYTVAFQSTNKAFNATAQFSCEMLAHTYMQEAISKNPALKKEIHIVPNYELQAS